MDLIEHTVKGGEPGGLEGMGGCLGLEIVLKPLCIECTCMCFNERKA